MAFHNRRIEFSRVIYPEQIELEKERAINWFRPPTKTLNYDENAVTQWSADGEEYVVPLAIDAPASLLEITEQMEAREIDV